MDTEQQAAADRIAAAKKGKDVRKKVRIENESATVVQARVRGRSDRTKLEGQGYYTPDEIKAHNRIDDLWVSMFGKVCDLTKLVAANPGSLVQPIIDAAGTDISHWFDPVTKKVKTYIDPKTELEVPFCPMGEFLHCPPSEPTAMWSSDIGKPWWNQHSGSYVWKRSDDHALSRVLDMKKTLAANGIPDEDLQFDLLNMDPDDHIPTIHLYFSDDLTVA